VTCELPQAPEDDEIILFGAYEADAMSTVTIAGQDESTQTARVVIAPGTSRLYVVLAAYENIIWRFEGDTARIDQVVLTGYGAQGVIGAPAVPIVDRSGGNGCPAYFYDVSSPEALAMQQAVEESIGRPVDVMAGSYSVGTLSLPAGMVAGTVPPSTPPPGLDPFVYQTHGLRFNPGGIIEIDPTQVTSSALHRASTTSTGRF
jgi:hypothetical protein